MNDDVFNQLGKLKDEGKLQAPAKKQSSLIDSLIPTAQASEGLSNDLIKPFKSQTSESIDLQALAKQGLVKIDSLGGKDQFEQKGWIKTGKNTYKWPGSKETVSKTDMVKGASIEVPQGGTNWESFKSTAARIAKEEDFPLGVLLSQAGLETGRGTSKNAKEKDNWFGLGAYDSDPSKAFRFKNAEESIRYYINLLKTDKRYAKAWAARHDPVKMVKEIKAAGYASDPDYIAKILSMPEF